MLSRSENTGERLERASDNMPGSHALITRGGSPVLTFGRDSLSPTRVWKVTSAGKHTPLVSVWMLDGSWEALIDPENSKVSCDTANIRMVIHGQQAVTSR